MILKIHLILFLPFLLSMVQAEAEDPSNLRSEKADGVTSHVTNTRELQTTTGESYYSWTGRCPDGGGDPNASWCNESEENCQACNGISYCSFQPDPRDFDEYRGCYRNTIPRYSWMLGSGYDLDTCDAACTASGGEWFGLRYGGDCICGKRSGFWRSSELVGESSCNLRCAANADHICGGGGAVSAYETTVENVYGSQQMGTPDYTFCLPDEHRCTPNTNSRGNALSCRYCCSLTGNGFDTCGRTHNQNLATTFFYSGCFVDTPERTLPINKGNGHTKESCDAECKDYTYFGLQWYGHCFCGDSVPVTDELQYDACDTPCDANQSQMCGGAWKNSVYQVRGKHPALLPDKIREAPECSSDPGRFLLEVSAYCRARGCSKEDRDMLRVKCSSGLFYSGATFSAGFLARVTTTTGWVVDLSTGYVMEFVSVCPGFGAAVGVAAGWTFGYMGDSTAGAGATFEDFAGWDYGGETDIVAISGVGVGFSRTRSGIFSYEISIMAGKMLNISGGACNTKVYEVDD